MINWNYLETFCLLAENLSFTQTAKELKTSQSAISRQIKKLESDLKCILFVRSKKQVSLSEKGQELKMQLLPIHNNLKNIFDGPSFNNKHNEKTKIRIGSIFEIGSTIIHPALKKIQKEYDQYIIHLEFGSNRDITEKLINGKIDFGLIHILPSTQLIRSYAIQKDHPVLIASNNSKIKLDANRLLDLVTYREEDVYTQNFLKKKFNKNQLANIQTVYSVNSHELMIDYLQDNLSSIAVVPNSSAALHLKNKKVQILAEESTEVPLYFSCNEFILLDHKKKFFLEHFLKLIK